MLKDQSHQPAFGFILLRLCSLVGIAESALEVGGEKGGGECGVERFVLKDCQEQIGLVGIFFLKLIECRCSTSEVAAKACEIGEFCSPLLGYLCGAAGEEILFCPRGERFFFDRSQERIVLFTDKLESPPFFAPVFRASLLSGKKVCHPMPNGAVLCHFLKKLLTQNELYDIIMISPKEGIFYE